MKKIPNSKMGYVFVPLVVLLLLGLPIAVWLDLSKLVETNLRRQASDINSIISSVRNYYANNVVGRVLASPGTTRVVHNYRDFPGAIPIPATLSLELGKVRLECRAFHGDRIVEDDHHAIAGKSLKRAAILDDDLADSCMVVAQQSDHVFRV